MKNKRELLIGCGNSRDKRVWTKEADNRFQNLTTLDIDKSCDPDIVWDLCELPYPFEDDTFDEIHAYEVLEHAGAQGDYKMFLGQFSEFWRISKPGGIFIGTVPGWNTEAAWGDPSHTRIIPPMALIFLCQEEYKKQVGETPMSDFRSIYLADFEIVHSEMRDGTFIFGLRVVKPAR